MTSRALKFKLLCGLEGCIPLNPTVLREVDSAKEFIDCVTKYKAGIRKFNDRNPSITWSPTITAKVSTLDEVIHDIINSRKYMNFPSVIAEDYEQLFELDFSTETISFYKKGPTSETDPWFEQLGSMHINTMFSNWREVFYGHVESFTEEDVEIEEDERVDEEESLFSYRRRQMQDALSTPQYDLWYMLFNETRLQEHHKVNIDYSGGGDSGDIDGVSVYIHEDGKYVGLGDISEYSDDSHKIYDAIWRVIDEKERGFVNNDGGRGSMIITMNKFSWEHENYYTETDKTVDMDFDFEGIEEEVSPSALLPSEIEEALSAAIPETKPEITLKDIVTEYHPEVLKSGSDFDIDKLPF